VNAMEIIAAFPMSPYVKEGLQKFQTWLDGFDPSDISASNASNLEEPSDLQNFHAGHKMARLRWMIPKNFPAENVLNAYLNPVVDNSSQSFSWGAPDVDKLVKFCTRNMGWEAAETRRMLDPITKRLESGSYATDSTRYIYDILRQHSIRKRQIQTTTQSVRGGPEGYDLMVSIALWPNTYSYLDCKASGQLAS
jgi:DNA excision repair protein ERCC-5